MFKFSCLMKLYVFVSPKISPTTSALVHGCVLDRGKSIFCQSGFALGRLLQRHSHLQVRTCANLQLCASINYTKIQGRQANAVITKTRSILRGLVVELVGPRLM
jgi:hypothetical protein